MTGGMRFDKTSGYLRVPRNGTYYMHSTIRFQRNNELHKDVEDLAVDIKIVTYCRSKYSTNVYEDRGFNPKHHVIIPKGKKGTSYSIHTSGIARLCENDTIYLHVQNMPHNIIIRNDGGGYTNFGAFMIAPSCQEEINPPITTATNPPTTRATTSTETTSTETPSSPRPDRCRQRTCR